MKKTKTIMLILSLLCFSIGLAFIGAGDDDVKATTISGAFKEGFDEGYNSEEISPASALLSFSFFFFGVWLIMHLLSKKKNKKGEKFSVKD